MKRKFVKTLALCIAITTMLSVFGISAGATTWSAEGDGATFVNSFEYQTSFDNSRGSAIYGFNTFAVNEVYIRSRHALNGHTARVQVGNGTPSSKDGQAGTWTPTAQAIHDKKTITYSVMY